MERIYFFHSLLVLLKHVPIVVTGADPAGNVRGGAIFVKFGGQVSLRVHHCKRDEHNIVVKKQRRAK